MGLNDIKQGRISDVLNTLLSVNRELDKLTGLEKLLVDDILHAGSNS